MPHEVIVVIPKMNQLKFKEYKSNLVKYVYVDFVGQVKQRIYGFSLANSDYVIQLDDDIIVDKYCFDNLLQSYKYFNGKFIVGPSFYFKDGTSCYANISKLSRLLSLLLFIKIKPGTVSPIGYGYGVNFSNLDLNYIQSDWLAGGCLLLHRIDLPKEVHFPYSGKAYCEDLIFSALMRRKNFKIYIAKNAICFIDRPILNNHNYDLNSDYKARKYLLSISNSSLLKLNIWYSIKRFILFVDKYIHI